VELVALGCSLYFLSLSLDRELIARREGAETLARKGAGALRNYVAIVQSSGTIFLFSLRRKRQATGIQRSWQRGIGAGRKSSWLGAGNSVLKLQSGLREMRYSQLKGASRTM
jgi:hypothetical protein